MKGLIYMEAKMVNQLIKTEEEVVDLTEKAVCKTENATVKYLLRWIQHDSRKHIELGRAALGKFLNSRRLWGRKKERKCGIC